jgi:hypothetical protein
MARRSYANTKAPVKKAPAQDIGVMADRVLQGDVIEASLGDGTYSELMAELRRRGYGLAQRSEAEKYLKPFVFRVEKAASDDRHQGTAS